MTSPRPTILLVDDDRDIRLATRIRLQAAGFDTIEACDGVAGVSLARKHRPTLILMDIRMPKMDGVAAVGALYRCQQTASIPIVMLSASLVDRNDALDAGASYFLHKPYRAEDLLDTVSTAMESTAEKEQPLSINAAVMKPRLFGKHRIRRQSETQKRLPATIEGER